MHCGWKTLLVPPDVEHCSVARIEVEGQQNKVRVRQIQVLAPPIKAIDSSYPASVAQQRACEAEALRVFRSLTSQVQSFTSCWSISWPQQCVRQRINFCKAVCMCYHKAVPQGVDLTATCSSTPSHTLKATAYFQTTNPNLGDYLRSNGVSYSNQLIIRLGGGRGGG